MNRKYVIHLTSVHPPFDTRIFYKECCSLIQAGYEVTIVAPHDRDDYADGMQIVAIPRARRHIQRMSLTTRQVYHKALQLDADLYHFHDPELIPIGLLLRAHGKRVIYDIHEDVPRSLAAVSRDYLPRYAGRPIGWFVKCVENLAAPWFSALVAATPTIGARFQALNGRTVVVNNYPLQNELLATDTISWDQRFPSAAYVGVIAPERGLYQMIEAMTYLPADLKATLKLAGAFSPRESRANAARLPGWERVEELGFLNRLEVARLLSQVFVGLVTLLPTSSYVESMPVKLFEYMSAGIPVIASDFPLWRKIIGDVECGLLVDPLNPRIIAGAIEYLLTHPEEAEAMGRRGREAVKEHYNWGSEESKLLELYADLLESG